VTGWFGLPDSKTLKLNETVNELYRRPSLHAAKSDGGVGGEPFALSISAYQGGKKQKVEINALIPSSRI
jgi:hypothetical protein